jgi:glycosyltransferase involved in cell wall biosynthesis
VTVYTTPILSRSWAALLPLNGGILDTMQPSSKISVFILAYNEEEKITDAINSVLWADEIIVADSFSQDKTAEIAASMGAQVVQVPFRGFGDLRNQALKKCAHPWIFSLDSDERCTASARDEILNLIETSVAHDVYFVPRKNLFMGKWIRHSGFYPNYRQPQLFRSGAMSYKPDPVHEGYLLHTDKPIGYLKNAIWQYPFRNFDEIIGKARRYSSLGAQRMAGEGRKSGLLGALAHATWAFVQHFIMKRGLFDGGAGFAIAFGNFEGTYYKYMKLYEINSTWRPPCSPPLTRPKRDQRL